MTAWDIGIAMDGDRDGVISFIGTNDTSYVFWVNDDVDAIADGEEDDKESGSADCSDNVITCMRDLEDFARLHIKIGADVSCLNGVTYSLKFENVTDTPMVNVFEAVKSTEEYLTATNVAAEQIEQTSLTPDGVFTTEVPLVGQYVKTGGEISPFLIEGCAPGTGDLTLIVKKDGTEICRRAVRLELKSFSEFYEKYVVAVTTNDDVSATSVLANTCTYTSANDEYILYVHGWNMADWAKDRWAETMFKRLWWQGYKGRVGCFQWPTYTGTLTYDASELRAWRSGQALNARIAALNALYPGQVRVLAHSMGNVVMGEALRLFSSPAVHTYIAAQAAISAHCYDNTVSNYWTGFTTPDIYARYSSGLSPDQPYLAANSGHAGKMASYFNAKDYALGWWETDNEAKPELDWNYWYTEGDDNVDSYAPAAGDRFYYDSLLPLDERTLTIPDDRFEIFARIAESRSRALGRLPSVAGFGTSRDLEDWGYDKEHYSHSREFRSNVAAETPFWRSVFQDCGFTR